MMGSQQESWLAHAMRTSVKSGRRWQVVGFGTIVGSTVMPAEAQGWLGGASERSRRYVADGIAAAHVGLPFNYDNWDGYPAARARFLRSVQAMGAGAVLISGDSHNAWAYNLAQDGEAMAVEFAGHSVSSPGLEGGVAVDPRLVAAELVRANPEFAWCDTSRRGYMALTIAPDWVSNDWILVDTIKRRSARGAVGHSTVVLAGRRRLA